MALDAGPIDAAQVDLTALILARNDSHPDGDWWYDPATGESLYLGLDDDEDLPALASGDHVLVPRAAQPASDVHAFLVSDEAAELDEDVLVDLARLVRGKGGARRFRERIGDSPAVDAWTRFTWRAEGRRALKWLVERKLVDPASARRVADELGPPL